MKAQHTSKPKRGATTTFGNVAVAIREATTADTDYEILIGIQRLTDSLGVTDQTFRAEDLDNLYTAVSWAIWLAEHWASDYSIKCAASKATTH